MKRAAKSYAAYVNLFLMMFGEIAMEKKLVLGMFGFLLGTMTVYSQCQPPSEHDMIFDNEVKSTESTAKKNDCDLKKDEPPVVASWSGAMGLWYK